MVGRKKVAFLQNCIVNIHIHRDNVFYSFQWKRIVLPAAAKKEEDLIPGNVSGCQRIKEIRTGKIMHYY